MQAKKPKTPNQKTNQTAPTLTVRQPPVNIWQFLAGTRRFQISASFQKWGLPSTVWAASQHGVTLPATAAWIHSGGKKTFKLILTHHWKLPVKVLWFTNLLSCYKQTFLFMIVSQGVWEPPCIFSPTLGISVQLKDTHSCLLILLAKPQPQTILTTPKRFWQLWHRTYGSCGKMCWQVPCRPHPAITYVENLMPDSSCCVEAAQYHTNQSCLILSFPFSVSTCCFLFLFIFFFYFHWKCSGAGTIILFCISASCHRVCFAWHSSNANSNAK